MEQRRLRIHGAVSKLFCDLPDFLVSSIRHENNTLEIKVEFKPFTDCELVTKRKKKAPPSKRVRNRKRLKEFLEKTKSEAYNTGAEEKSLGKDPGDPVFGTPTTNLGRAAGEEFDQMQECEDFYDDGVLLQSGNNTCCDGDPGAEDDGSEGDSHDKTDHCAQEPRIESNSTENQSADKEAGSAGGQTKGEESTMETIQRMLNRNIENIQSLQESNKKWKESLQERNKKWKESLMGSPAETLRMHEQRHPTEAIKETWENGVGNSKGDIERATKDENGGENKIKEATERFSARWGEVSTTDERPWWKEYTTDWTPWCTVPTRDKRRKNRKKKSKE